MTFVVCLFVFSAAFLCAGHFLAGREMKKLASRLETRRGEAIVTAKTNAFLPEILGLFERLSALNDWILRGWARGRVARRLEQAKTPVKITPGAFVTMQELCACAGLAAYRLLMGRLDEVGAMVAGVGFMFPWFRLGDMIKSRRFMVAKTLPLTLDLMAACAEAGLSFEASVNRIVDRMKDGPLKDEFVQMIREMRLGKTRREALKDMAARADQQDLSAAVFAMIQADQLGTGIAHAVRTEARQLRIKRSHRAEKLALEAPVKLLFPLIVFIFPTVFIVIVGPIVLKLLSL